VAAPLFGGSVHSGSSRVSGLAVFLGLPVGRRRRAWIFFSFAVRRLGLGFLALALTLDLVRSRVAMDAFVQIKLERPQV